MTDQVHWWLAALSFGFGLVLTYTLMVRPAWAVVVPAPSPKPKPPVMKTTAAEAPTKKLPASTTGPAKKKAASDRPPTKRRPVAGDAVTERIPVAGEAATERIPVAGDAATQQIPVVKKTIAKKAVKKTVAKKGAVKKVPGKKVPGKKLVPRSGQQPGMVRKVRPKGPGTRRIPGAKGAATEKLSAGDLPTTLIPLIPYAPYGPGSMRADHDGSGPEGWPIKGRMDSRLFYGPDDPDYDDIVAQVWFEDEDLAARAFFTAWRKSSRKT